MWEARGSREEAPATARPRTSLPTGPRASAPGYSQAQGRGAESRAGLGRGSGPLGEAPPAGREVSQRRPRDGPELGPRCVVSLPSSTCRSPVAPPCVRTRLGRSGGGHKEAGPDHRGAAPSPHSYTCQRTGVATRLSCALVSNSEESPSDPGIRGARYQHRCGRSLPIHSYEKLPVPPLKVQGVFDPWGGGETVSRLPLVSTGARVARDGTRQAAVPRRRPGCVAFARSQKEESRQGRFRGWRGHG